MTPLGHHIVLRLENDRTVAETIRDRRRLACATLAAAQPFPFLAFRWADNHGHAVVVADRAEAAECARRIEIAISLALDVGIPFAPARLRPIYDTTHLRNTFLYIIGQDTHHSIEIDPTFEASNVPDLLGARITGAWTRGHVRTHLPRIQRADILRAARLSDPELAAPTLVDLRDAAAAAIGRETLFGREALTVAARRAACHLARAEGADAVAAALGITSRGVRKSLAAPADSALVRAILQQLGLRAQPSVTLTPALSCALP